MKPVAWWHQGDSWEFISGGTKPPVESFGESIPLYTADQLREAQVEVLESLAKRFEHRTFCSTDVREYSKEYFNG